MNTLKVMKSHKEAIVPKYATKGAACFDFHSLTEGTVGLGNLSRVFETGLKFQIPEGWVMLIFSRSGHGFNSDVRLSNCVGVIDSDYRGEVKIKLRADSSGVFTVLKGDRIAQGFMVPAQQWELEEVLELSETVRGEGGYGSTGTGRNFIGQSKEN